MPLPRLPARDEPGCAVREGIDADRLRNYHKLLREMRRDTIRRSIASASRRCGRRAGARRGPG